MKARPARVAIRQAPKYPKPSAPAAVLTDPRSTREGGKIVVSSDVSPQLPLCTVHIANRTPPRPTERALKVTNAAERALIRKERKRGWPFG